MLVFKKTTFGVELHFVPARKFTCLPSKGTISTGHESSSNHHGFQGQFVSFQGGVPCTWRYNPYKWRWVFLRLLHPYNWSYFTLLVFVVCCLPKSIVFDGRLSSSFLWGWDLFTFIIGVISPFIKVITPNYPCVFGHL